MKKIINQKFISIFVLFLLIIFGLFTRPINAANKMEVSVSDFNEFKQAVIDANNDNANNHVINISNDIDLSASLTISSNIEITSNNAVSLKRAATFTNGVLFTINTNGHIILDKDITIDGANIVNTLSNAFTLKNNGILEINGAKITNHINNAAAITAANTSKVYLNSGNIDNNMNQANYSQAIYGGGALNIGDQAYFEMNGGSISGNSSTLYGGGINVNGKGTVILNNGLIDGNTNTSTQSGKNSGGGIFINSTANFTMNNAIISNNTSGQGAGIQLGLTTDYNYLKDEPGTHQIIAGQIINNKTTTGGGGGIFIAGYKNTLNLENVLVLNNKASYGGGLFNCSTGTSMLYVTNGSAFINNTANIAGDFLAFEQHDSKIDFDIYFSSRMLGAAAQQYYYDNPNDRYQEGGQAVPPSDLTNIDKNLFAVNKYPSNALSLAQPLAQLIISGNEAIGSGGGIANNAPLVIGQIGLDKTLSVEKIWDINGEVPESISIELVRVDKVNNEKVIIESVALNKTNNFKYKFIDLPGNFDYEINELNNDAYEMSSEVSEDGNDISIVITNKDKLISVLPIEPTLDKNVKCEKDYKIILPEVTGVEYTMSEKVDGKIIVSAKAKEGYVLAKDATTQWTFEVTNPHTCPIKPPTKPDKPNPGEKPEPGIPDVVEPTNPLTPETEKPTTTPTPLKPGESLPGTGSKAIVGSVMALVITSGLIVVRRIIN